MKELKKVLNGMQISYSTFNDNDTPYNKAFMQKLDESIKEAQEGKVSFIKTDDLWK